MADVAARLGRRVRDWGRRAVGATADDTGTVGTDRASDDRAADGAPSDRAQLFLVGALSLAVLFVALALLLNTAIYTDNLAARGASADAGAVVEYRNVAADGAALGLRGANYRNNSSYADLESALDANVAAWASASGTHRAADGVAAGTEMDSVVRGTRIEQDEVREFTNRSGAQNWTAARDVHARNFTMVVESNSLISLETDDDTLGEMTGSDLYYLTLTDSTDQTWYVFLYEASVGTVGVEVWDETSRLGTCTASGSSVTVDVTNASVGGSRCAPLAFFDDVSGTYDLAHHTGSLISVQGTYSLVVDRPVGDFDTTTSGHYYADADGSSPYVTPALYSADVRVTYRDPAVDYETTVRVAPGEPDA